MKPPFFLVSQAPNRQTQKQDKHASRIGKKIKKKNSQRTSQCPPRGNADAAPAAVEETASAATAASLVIEELVATEPWNRRLLLLPADTVDVDVDVIVAALEMCEGIASARGTKEQERRLVAEETRRGSNRDVGADVDDVDIVDNDEDEDEDEDARPYRAAAAAMALYRKVNCWCWSSCTSQFCSFLCSFFCLSRAKKKNWLAFAPGKKTKE